jgi:hypothetical protein
MSEEAGKVDWVVRTLPRIAQMGGRKMTEYESVLTDAAGRERYRTPLAQHHLNPLAAVRRALEVIESAGGMPATGVPSAPSKANRVKR